jgi:hypothetical protein
LSERKIRRKIKSKLCFDVVGVDHYALYLVVVDIVVFDHDTIDLVVVVVNVALDHDPS